MIRPRLRQVLGMAALVAASSMATGCQQALVCDVSVFSVGSVLLAPGDGLPPNAERILDADDFDTTRATLGTTDLGTEVQLQLHPAAADRFRQFTAANLGESIAISLNGAVVTAPIIEGEIPDGALSVTLEPGSTANDAFARCITGRALPQT